MNEVNEIINNHENQEVINWKKRSFLQETWRRLKKNKGAIVGLFMISIIICFAIFADLISNYDIVVNQNISEKFQLPSGNHWFGTDEYGRDIFARIVHGSRISLTMGIFPTAIALIVGSIIGAASGYYGGIIDNIIMRISDVFMCIPSILLALAIISALGPSILNLQIAMLISLVPEFVRVVRSVILTVVSQEYIEAAKTCGTSDFRIILKHVIPNAMGPIIIQGTMAVSGVIVATAGLSFIGMGIQAPIPEWGAMLSSGREYMRYYPHLVLFPGLFITISALSLNMLGDGLRDALDPKLKN